MTWAPRDQPCGSSRAQSRIKFLEFKFIPLPLGEMLLRSGICREPDAERCCGSSLGCGRSGKAMQAKISSGSDDLETLMQRAEQLLSSERVPTADKQLARPSAEETAAPA